MSNYSSRIFDLEQGQHPSAGAGAQIDHLYGHSQTAWINFCFLGRISPESFVLLFVGGELRPNIL